MCGINHKVSQNSGSTGILLPWIWRSNSCQFQQFACQLYPNGNSCISLLRRCTPSTALYTLGSPNVTFALTCRKEEKVKDQSNWTAHCSRLVSTGKRWWSLQMTWILITFILWWTGGRRNIAGLARLFWHTWCEERRRVRESRKERRISGQTSRYQTSMQSSWFTTRVLKWNLWWWKLKSYPLLSDCFRLSLSASLL